MEYMELSNGVNLPAIGFGPGICGYSAKYVRRRSGLLSIPGRAYNKLVKKPFIEKEYVLWYPRIGGVCWWIKGRIWAFIGDEHRRSFRTIVCQRVYAL